MSQTKQLVPITILTGFLGSGKTTLVNWLLSHEKDEQISVILNEFGDIKLESQFISEKRDDIIELKNGCMCCVAKDDVPRVINYLIDQSSKTKHIVIEASGLSDPDPIKEAMHDPSLEGKARLVSMVCVIDCKNFLETYQKHPLVLTQAGDSDIIVLSKYDLASIETQDKVKRILGNNLPDIPIVIWDKQMTRKQLLSPLTANEVESIQSHHHLHEQFAEYWFKTAKRLDEKLLSTAFDSLAEDVYRAKGHFINQDGQGRLVQFVAGKLELLDATKKNIDSTAILFLGPQLNSKLIQKALKTSLYKEAK